MKPSPFHHYIITGLAFVSLTDVTLQVGVLTDFVKPCEQRCIRCRCVLLHSVVVDNINMSAARKCVLWAKVELRSGIFYREESLESIVGLQRHCIVSWRS